jgi:hypothetical protein
MILSRAGFALHADDLSVNVAGNMPSLRSFPGSEYPGTSVTLGDGPYTVHADRDRTLNGRTHITGYQFQEVTVQVQFTQVTIDAFIQGINPAKIYDAGKTQLEPSTFTTLGIGPAPEYKIDLLIKDLKLL